MKAKSPEAHHMNNGPRTKDPGGATVGWTAWGTGTVGVTKGETLRMCTVNVGSFPTVVLCGLWSNPALVQDSFTLQPGESRCCDVSADDVPKDLFDRLGRVQVRGFVRSSSKTVMANVELFDSGTGRTSIVLPLQKLRC